MSVVDFALTHNLSNNGVEEMLAIFKTMSEGKSHRISDIPKTWRTLQGKMMEGFDSTTLRQYSFPVPSDLGFDFGEVPYVLKTYESILEEMLFNIETMDQGNFFFGEQPPPPGGK